MIRLAEIGDLDAVRTCARLSYEKYVARIGREPAPMIADFAALIGRQAVHVDVHGDGALQGFIVFYPRGRHMHLENVAVMPEYQGAGIGRRLITFCEAQARTAGLDAIELYTNAKMTENLDYYPRIGFEEIGRGQQDGFDRVFYRKALNPSVPPL